MASPHVRWSKLDPAPPGPAPERSAPPPPPPPANERVRWSLFGSRDAGAGGAVAVPPRFFTPHPPVLVCPRCNHRDTGEYCSTCGGELVPERFSVSRSMWKHMVHERLVDGLAMFKTSWLMLVAPVEFFRAVLQTNGYLAQRPFFLTGLWRRVSRRPQEVLDPVKYLLLAYGLAVVLSWFGENQTRLPEWMEETIRFAWPLAVVLWLSLYSRCLALMLGGRVPCVELTRFMLYLAGLATLLGGFVTLSSENDLALVALFALTLFVSLVVPYLALPRLYGFSRRALFLAQLGVVALMTGSVVLVIVLGVGVYAAAGGTL